MIVRLRGVKRVRAKGRLYHYHRASGTRLMAPPGTAEFAAELAAAARAHAEGAARQAIRPGTLEALVLAYKSGPEFAALAPRTRRDYDGVFAWLRPIGATPLHLIDPPLVMGIRDKAFAAHRRRFANRTLAVLRLLFGWGLPRGLVDGNPAAGLPKIRRPAGTPTANRPWTAAELAAVMAAAPPHLRLAVAIGAWTAMREGDMLRLPWSAWDGRALRWRQSKTGREVVVAAHPALRAILDAAPRRAVVVVATSAGRAFSESGFRASFFKLLRRLRDAGTIGPGLTFHGLRHTLATRLADGGADTRDIMAVTGHATDSEVARYTAAADRHRRARDAIRRLK